MKSLQIWFEDADFEKLKRAKGSGTWRKLFLSLVDKEARAGSSGPARSEPTPPVEKVASVN